MPSHAPLQSPVVTLQWHEIVAAVQEVASQVLAAGSCVAPTADQVSIGRDGVIGFASGRMTAGSRPDEKGLVNGLGGLLKDLLGASVAPEQLSGLADVAAADPPGFSSVSDFSRALAFFERPDRRAVLSGLADRVFAAAERTQIESELEDLTRKARMIERPSVGKDRGNPAVSRVRRRLTVAVAGLATLALVTVAVIIHRNPGAPSLASGRDVVEAGARLVDAMRTKAHAVLGGGQETAGTPSASTVATREAETRRPLSGSGRSSSHERRQSRLETVPLIVPRALLADPQPMLNAEPQTPAPEHERVSAEVVPISGDVLEAIFDPDDAEVEPPKLLRPQLPAEPAPGVDATMLSVVEIVVGRDGTVDQVRVVANPASRRYYTAMLVSAVKTWKFQPALRDATPVRYRTRIALTQ
jgi:hypothetical protein